MAKITFTPIHKFGGSTLAMQTMTKKDYNSLNRQTLLEREQQPWFIKTLTNTESPKIFVGATDIIGRTKASTEVILPPKTPERVLIHKILGDKPCPKPLLLLYIISQLPEHITTIQTTHLQNPTSLRLLEAISDKALLGNKPLYFIGRTFLRKSYNKLDSMLPAYELHTSARLEIQKAIQEHTAREYISGLTSIKFK